MPGSNDGNMPLAPVATAAVIPQLSTAPIGGGGGGGFTPPQRQPLTTHPASAFTPTASQQLHNAQAPTMNYDIFTVQPPTPGADFARVPGPAPPSTAASSQPIPTNSLGAQYNMNNPNPANVSTASASTFVHQRSLDNDPSAMIFSPPNSVHPDHQRPITQPDPSSYVAPTKAAGDVSLSGPQLVGFLTKATLRLPQGATQEGIQLRFGEFHELANAQRFSEACIKKLNFVVDAIDRMAYDEAWQFFEQFQAAFPSEMGRWTQGLRILIQELRRSTQSRAGSAGPRFAT
jgi:hypothetical protein